MEMDYEAEIEIQFDSDSGDLEMSFINEVSQEIAEEIWLRYASRDHVPNTDCIGIKTTYVLNLDRDLNQELRREIVRYLLYQGRSAVEE